MSMFAIQRDEVSMQNVLSNGLQSLFVIHLLYANRIAIMAIQNVKFIFFLLEILRFVDW